METTETTKMTCDDFIAALKRKDFTPDDLRNIARWAKQEEKRLAKNGIAGARVGDTLIISSRMGETARVTLDKVNQTKAGARDAHDAHRLTAPWHVFPQDASPKVHTSAKAGMGPAAP